MIEKEYESEEQLNAAIGLLEEVNGGVDFEVNYVLKVNGSNQTDTDDETGSVASLTPQSKKIAKLVGSHRRKWVNTADIAAESEYDNVQVSQSLRELWDKDWAVRREHTRQNCTYEYRLKDAYRRESGLVGGGSSE